MKRELDDAYAVIAGHVDYREEKHELRRCIEKAIKPELGDKGHATVDTAIHWALTLL